MCTHTRLDSRKKRFKADLQAAVLGSCAAVARFSCCFGGSLDSLAEVRIVGIHLMFVNSQASFHLLLCELVVGTERLVQTNLLLSVLNSPPTIATAEV